MKTIFIFIFIGLFFAYCKKDGHYYRAHHVEYTTDLNVYPYNGTKGDATDYFFREDKDDAAAWEWYKQTYAYQQIPADTCWVEYVCTAEEWKDIGK